jgi:hypothetical protein
MSKELFLTGKEAAHLFKNANNECKYAIAINSDVCVPKGAGVVERIKGASSRYLTISRAQAVKLVRGFVGEELEKQGGRVKITELEWNKGGTVYWIG